MKTRRHEKILELISAYDIDTQDELLKRLSEAGFDPVYGARPLRRAIQNKVEDLLAEEILRGKIQRGDEVRLTLNGKEIKISINSPNALA